MLVCRTSQRLFSAKRAVYPLRSSPPTPAAVPCRQSAVTLVTVAPSQHPAPASPTSKSASRAKLLAGHLHTATTSSPSSSAAIHTAREKLLPNMTYTTRKIGAPNSLEHRIYIEKDGQLVSPWHDIPLYANEQQTVLNMVVEVPRWTNAKMEASDVPLVLLENSLNPLREQLLTDCCNRSPRRRLSTLFYRTRRRESSAS